MKVGLYLATQFTPQTPLGPQTANLVEQVRVARANGFESLWAAQHFITAPVQMFQTMPLLARLIPEAEGMQVGPNILVFPALNPVLVAEEAATMDWLSDGRYVLGLGLGYREDEFTALGAPFRDRVGRLREGVGLVRRLWTGERVTHHGKHFRVDDAALSLKPKQQPGPPIWIAAVVEKAIERAATLGDEWLITFYPTVASLEQQMRRYREVRADAGLAPATEYPICRECYVGATGKRPVRCAGALAVQVRRLRLLGAGRHPRRQRPLRSAVRRVPQGSLHHRRRSLGAGRARTLSGHFGRTALHHADAVAGAGAKPGAAEHRASREDRGVDTLTRSRAPTRGRAPLLSMSE